MTVVITCCDLSASYSHLTQEEVDEFCIEWGIGLKYNPVVPGCDKFVDQCPPGSITLYCHHFEFSNLCHPFSIFVLNVLEYYRVSFGQIHPQGLARVLHFEVLCQASGYHPTLLSFRRFFRLAKNGECLNFETSKVDTCLVSSMVTTLGCWKDRFFWVSESIVPFKMICRHPDAVLNEAEPSDSELNSCFLKAIRESFEVMSALDFVKSDDTSNVAFTDAEAASSDDAVVRGSEHMFNDAEYVSVPNVKGFTNNAARKTLTRRSARYMLKGARQSTYSDYVDLSDDIEVSWDQGPGVDAEKEKNFIVLGKKKSAGKKAMVTFFKEYEEFSKKKEKMKACMAAMKKHIDGFVKKEESWVKKVGELTRRHEIEIGDLKKKMEENKLQLKADREALDVQKKAFAEEKEGLKAFKVQATSDNKWLIEQGFQQVVTYFLRSNELSCALGDVYTKFLNYGKHMVLVAGFKLHESGQALEQSPLFRPEASEIFKESVQKMERLTYPYVSEVSSCFGKPLSVLQELKLVGLNEKVCSEVHDSLSKKRSHSGDSEEIFSEDADVSKEANLDGLAVAGDGGQKSKKAKKAKKGKGDGARASKPCSDV
ncbi:hypothetical protein Hdeb2414_s0065g00766801 [Helianthus debilis subsp. tardiflorus]